MICYLNCYDVRKVQPVTHPYFEKLQSNVLLFRMSKKSTHLMIMNDIRELLSR